MSNLRHESFLIPAGESRHVTGPGNFILIEEATAPFNLYIDGGPKREVRGGQRVPNDAIWNMARLENASSTKALRVRIKAGVGDGESAYAYIPPSSTDGVLIAALADGSAVDLLGVDSSGRRRKEVTITLKPSLAGTVQIRNKTSGRLMALIAASSSGGGFRIETDEDLTLTNKTGGAIDSTTATPDIAVYESFYP